MIDAIAYATLLVAVLGAVIYFRPPRWMVDEAEAKMELGEKLAHMIEESIWSVYGKYAMVPQIRTSEATSGKYCIIKCDDYTLVVNYMGKYVLFTAGNGDGGAVRLDYFKLTDRSVVDDFIQRNIGERFAELQV